MEMDEVDEARGDENRKETCNFNPKELRLDERL